METTKEGRARLRVFCEGLIKMPLAHADQRDGSEVLTLALIRDLDLLEEALEVAAKLDTHWWCQRCQEWVEQWERAGEPFCKKEGLELSRPWLSGLRRMADIARAALAVRGAEMEAVRRKEENE